jgi:hypothetical protein
MSRLAAASLATGIGLLVVTLGLLGYAFSRPDLRQALFSFDASAAELPQGTASETGAAAAGAVGTTPAASLAVAAPQQDGAASPNAADAATLDAMMAQLGEMQQSLQAAAEQMGAAPAVSGTGAVVAPTAAPAATPAGAAPRRSFGEATTATGKDAALVAEIEQLYQSMRPLMVQMELASTTGRSPSELAAMRSQMAEIHARLTGLMAQVAQTRQGQPAGAAPTPNQLPTGSGAPGSSGGVLASEDEVYVQLQQSLADLAVVLQQLAGSDGSSGQ